MSPKRRPNVLRSRMVIALTCCSFAVAAIAWAQGRKPGLYDVTSTMTWQQSPFPAGMGPGGGKPMSSQVCVTQEQIDKFGTVPPQPRGDCQVTNVTKKADGYAADIACNGRVAAKGTVNASFGADGHGKTTIHLLGSMQMGPNAKPVEYTIVSDSNYKGADCGAVKAMAAAN